MLFWEARFKHMKSDEDGYAMQLDEGPNFFATLEECMAFVLSQPHLNITDIEFHQRSLGTWKSEITLNAPNKVV